MPNSLQRRPLERLFFAGVISTGLTVATLSAIRVWEDDVLYSNWLAPLAALTLLTGSFTIRIPRLSIRISVSDAFVFAAALLFDPHVPTVIVAVDSLVATFWMRRENRSTFRSAFNVSVASLSIWVASHIYAQITPDSESGPTYLLWQPFVLAAVYFLLNSWLIAIPLAFERQTKVYTLWWTHFPWFSLNYFGGVSVAALLVAYRGSLDLSTVTIILPLLLISYLTYKTSLGRVQDAQRHLDQLNDLYMSTIEALAMAVDAKDQITHGHIRRVQVYAVALAKQLGVVDQEQLHAIETAALLHDMGKLAIPEHILNKPGHLTVTEFEKMKRHADIGADLLSSIKFPYPVVPIVRHHHEHWNGGGYPTGIAGTDIPLGARILSVVDCFDALTSDRPYRPRLPHHEAFDVLRQRRGVIYDPLVVDTFIKVYPEIAPHALRVGHEARTIVADGTMDSEDGAQGPFRQIRAAAYENSVLTGLHTRLAAASSIDELADEVSHHLRQLTPATTIALFVHDPETDAVVCKATAGDPHNLLLGLTIRIGERVTGWSAANRRTSVNSHAYLDLGPLSELLNLKSSISTSLLEGDRLVGVLSAYSPTQEAFTDSHRYILEHIAELAGKHLRRGQSGGYSQAAIVAIRGSSGRPLNSL